MMRQASLLRRLSSASRSFWIVVGWAAALRALHLFGFYANSPFSETLISDAHIFDSWARRIAAGDILGDSTLFILPPLYAYWVGLLYAILGHTTAVVLAIQAALGVVSTGLIWRLGSRRFGPASGVAAGLLYGSVGTVLFYESMLVGTALAGALTVCAMSALDEWLETERTSYLGFCAVCFGLLVLLRPNFMVVLPGLFWIVYRASRDAQLARCSGILVALFLLPSVGLAARNGLAAGEWTPFSAHGGINFYMGNHPGAPGWFAPPPGMASDITPQQPRGNLIGPRRVAENETGVAMTDREVSAYWFGKGVDYFVEMPGAAVAGLLRKTRLFLSSFEIPLNYSFEYHRQFSIALGLPFGQFWFLGPLSLIGLAIAIRDRAYVADLLLVGGLYAFGVILFHVSTRYRMPVVPFLALLAGVAVGEILSLIRQQAWPKLGGFAAATLVVVAVSLGERATWAHERSLSMDPYNLGTSYLYKGQADKALPYLVEARDAGGTFPGLHYNLGLVFAAMGSVDAALTSYAKAVDIDPKFSAAHTNLGNIHFQAGRYTEAAAAYRDAIAHDRYAHNARAALGWVHFTYHRNDSARVAWSNVLRMDPSNASALAGMDRLRSLR